MAKPRREPSKARAERNETRKEGIVLIPLKYNDGSEVPIAVLDAICEEMFLAFDGWTIEGTVEGAYRMHSGEKCVEKLMKVSIILKESQARTLEKMVARWGAQLGQETMLLKMSDYIVKFIPPQTEVQES